MSAGGASGAGTANQVRPPSAVLRIRTVRHLAAWPAHGVASSQPVDADAASERGIVVTSTGYFSEPTVELTWALIHAWIRDIVAESSSVRAGGWQRSVGADLAGQVLGVLGLGNDAVAHVGRPSVMAP